MVQSVAPSPPLMHDAQLSWHAVLPYLIGTPAWESGPGDDRSTGLQGEHKTGYYRNIGIMQQHIVCIYKHMPA